MASSSAPVARSKVAHSTPVLVLAVHAVDERGASLGGHGAQGLAHQRILAHVAAVVRGHALLRLAVALDDAGDEALVGILAAVLGGRLQRHGAHAHDVGLRVRRHLGGRAQVVNGGDAEGAREEGRLLTGEVRELPRAEDARVLERAAHGPDARIPVSAPGGQRLEGEAGHECGGLAVLGHGSHLQEVASGSLRRVDESPVHAAALVYGGGGVGRPGGAVVQRELHGADRAVEVVHIAGELDGLPGIVGWPRVWGERIIGSVGHGPSYTKSPRISSRVRARWAKACSPAAESGALVMMVMR